MLQINVQPETFRFEASPVLAELVLRVLIGKINAERPNENAPTSAVRAAIRSDFAQRIGEALKAEETGSRTRATLIEKLEGSGLDSVGAQLKLERLEGEKDVTFRVRLNSANAVEEQPLHKTIRQIGTDMIDTLAQAEPIASLVSELAASYGVP